MFFYRVHFFEKSKNKLQVDCGLVCAASYGAAADKIVGFYGEENFICFDEFYCCEGIITFEELIDMFGVKE